MAEMSIFAFEGMRLEQKKRLLAQVDEAISKILGGAQAYTIGSRSLTRADLDKLIRFQRQLEADIMAAVDDANLLANTSVAYFDRR